LAARNKQAGSGKAGARPAGEEEALPAARSGEAGRTARAPLEPRPRPRLGVVALLIGAQAAYLAVVYALAIAHTPPGSILPADDLRLPGSEAVLSARLERDLPLLGVRPLRDVEVVFDALPAAAGARPEEIGRARTDPAGVARVSWKAPAEAGAVRWRARVEGEAAVAPREAEAALLVAASGARLVLIEAHAALQERTLTADPGAPHSIVLRAGAAEALAQLARDSAVAYVGTLPGDPPPRLRAWLEARALPPGAVLFAPRRAGREEEWQHFRSFASAQSFSPWKDRGWAVCASDEAARGFSLAGFRAIIVGGDASRADGRRVFAVRGWAEVLQTIERIEKKP
jgi:hypothetical protein